MQLIYTDNCPANVSQRLAYTEEESKTEAEIEETNINLYPNPNNGNMFVAYNITNNAVMEVTDVTGKVISKYVLDSENNNIEINNTDVVNGVYLYRIISGNQLLKTGKIVIMK